MRNFRKFWQLQFDSKWCEYKWLYLPQMRSTIIAKKNPESDKNCESYIASKFCSPSFSSATRDKCSSGSQTQESMPFVQFLFVFAHGGAHSKALHEIYLLWWFRVQTCHFLTFHFFPFFPYTLLVFGYWNRSKFLNRCHFISFDSFYKITINLCRSQLDLQFDLT